ncbi:hypothetical protein CYY_008736 [Polysphondylium violaceum]|uniref:ATP-polyphosphate phosphotransferase n=1 Tax=Polysphondylium violaceum TaxID=133409 RepID=A0A8J4PMI8_9MYCE|nr:hypothetical protein CYY_008736 [Polysphondylium violaceum]
MTTTSEKVNKKIQDDTNGLKQQKKQDKKPLINNQGMISTEQQQKDKDKDAAEFLSGNKNNKNFDDIDEDASTPNLGDDSNVDQQDEESDDEQTASSTSSSTKMELHRYNISKQFPIDYQDEDEDYDEESSSLGEEDESDVPDKISLLPNAEKMENGGKSNNKSRPRKKRSSVGNGANKTGAIDKKLSETMIAESGQLFSPTEFVKSSTVPTGAKSPVQPLLLNSMLGFDNLGASNVLQVQNPTPIPNVAPSATTPLLNSSAPPVTNVLPDPDYCHRILDNQENYVVPSADHKILDIDNLFNDLAFCGQSETTPGSTPKHRPHSFTPNAGFGFIPLKLTADISPTNGNGGSSSNSNSTSSGAPFSLNSLVNGNGTNNNTPTTTTTTTTTTTKEEEIPLDLKILQLSGSRLYFNRELTELIYFYRILYEGYGLSLPVLERVRFLAITSQNLDMYFCKRALKLRLGYISTRKSLKPEERYINMVLNTTRNLINEMYNLYCNILLPELSNNNVFILKHQDLTDSEKIQLRGFFLQHVFPLMTPLVVDAGHPFPNLSNLSLNIAVLLKHDEENTRFVRIKVPQRIPRFVHIKQRAPYSIIPMEEIILANLDTLFPNTKILTKSLFRVTRHNDLKLNNEDQANDLLELIKTELHKRKFAPMVRLEVSHDMPVEILDMLKTQLHLENSDVFIINGPLGLSDLFELCKLNLPHLKFEPWNPHIPSCLVKLTKYPMDDIFSIIRKGELLINLPYLSFNSSVQFFIESAVKDPKVLAIKMSIYRTNSNSQLIRALCEAAAHKEVSVLIDLKASGDEELNTKFARLLEQAGCHVSYGLVGLKTHAKIAMVVREEENGLREYLHISTGNYNASTADIYADMGLFSCDQDLGQDMCNLFNYLTGYSRVTSFKKLLIAPMNMRSTLIQLIENEAKNAREGKEASIYAVMNGLDDKRLVNCLYQASVAGVKINLVVRGRCRILPGVPGISDNIKVISILGRFLEHSRIYCFHNNGNKKAYIASADWLHRNLKRRVEVMVPVEDPNNIKQLYDIIDVYLNDTNAWEMLPDGRYKKRSKPIGEDSQTYFMKSTIQKHPVIWTK